MGRGQLILGGITFEIAGSTFPDTWESTYLAQVNSVPELPGAEPWILGERVVDVHLVDQALWRDGEGPVSSPETGAGVTTRGDEVLVGGNGFQAVIPLHPQPVLVWRRKGSHGALALALRVALCCRLPHFGGLPLHSAGVYFPEGSAAFFGPSGAGKTTLSLLSSYPVLSDELVIVKPSRGNRGFTLSASGHFGAMEGRGFQSGDAPLSSLVSLRKEQRFRWTRLSAREALTSMLGVVMLPGCEVLWRAAVGAVGEVLTAVPVRALGWRAPNAPFDEIRAALSGLVPLASSPHLLRRTLSPGQKSSYNGSRRETSIPWRG